MKVVRVLFVAVSTLVAGAALQAQPPATPPTILHRFSAQLRAGMAPLTEAPDGRLFGVMEQGGLRDQGAVYVLTPDGNGGHAFSVLWWFNGFNGRKPTGLTYSAVDDKLYGTTSEGGVNGSIYDGMGTVFSLNSDGTGFAKLIDFDLAFSVPQPGHPQAGLLEASDGYFYGTGSSSSNATGAGAIFRMDRTGAYDVIWTFHGTDGGTPQSKLVEGSDGFLYGTTAFGGASNAGTVFKIDKAGAALTTLYQFTGTATHPRGLLLDTSTGSDIFYGLTGGGGTGELGSVFSITPSGTFTTIASFTMTPGFSWATQGAYPNGALVKGSNGLLYGTTESAGPIPFGSLGVVFSVDPASGEIAVVHDYTSDPGTGFRTTAGLIVAADGTLVGTTLNGGAHRAGTAYRVDVSAASPVVSKIADFPSQGPSIPQHRLLRASDGFLYGTTQSGGDFNSGTIVRYANGVATAIHDFNFADGHQPSGELVEGSDGFLYGTTPYGGNVLFPGDVGGGTIYRIAKDGSGFAVVHRFSDYATEGAYPLAGLVEGPDGNFYGTTHQNGPGGAGTVFKVTPSGTLTTLHAFNVWSSTTGTLVIGEDGYFYGVTREGGSTPTGGTIYKIDSEGNFVLLHEFVDIADGAHPNALALGTDGNLYGTTEHGGTFFGTLFRTTSTGVFTVLHRFHRDVDGSDPMSAPFEAGDGSFYGSAWLGGRVASFVSGVGTLYRYGSSGVQLLHTFDGREFGEIAPLAGLTQGSDNRLYGALTDPAGGALYAIDPGITNKAPIVRHQRLSIAPGQLETINLTASDPDGDPLTFTIVGQPAHGTVNGSGPAYQYQPTPGFSGTDYFYVRANDGTVSSAVAGVMINVGTANTPPVAYDGTYSTAEDFSVGTYLITFDAEQNPLSFTVVTPPAHGTLSGAAPDFIYNPAPNYNGPDSFTFKVNDGTAESNVATISITVDPVNDAPVASDQSLASNASAPVPLALSAVDPDGDPLSYHIVDPPQHGVLTGSAPNLTYTPETGFSGTDTFTFYAQDGTVASNVATVTITVQAPVAIGTTTTLQTSATIVGMLQPLTLTATVSPVSGGGIPTGNVMFMLNGSLMVGLVPLVNGVATLHGNGGAAPAVSSITAHYAGAGSFTASSSAAVSITTLPGSASSFTFLLPWTNPQALGSPVTVSAYVLALGTTAPTPTGTVEFYDGAALVATAALSSGLATVTFLPSIGGTHTLWAKYLGSGTFAGSTAAPAQITVFSGAMPAATTTALTVTPNPAQTFAQPVTFTATVSGGVTGGTVTFFMDGVEVGTAPVLNVGGTMRATLSLQDVALGARVVSASYGGAPGFAASNSAPLILTARP